jgi:hypothetical protein
MLIGPDIYFVIKSYFFAIYLLTILQLCTVKNLETGQFGCKQCAVACISFFVAEQPRLILFLENSGIS